MRDELDGSSVILQGKSTILVVEPSKLSGRLTLPSSKSHLMRWLILSSMDKNPTKIIASDIGNDVNAMIDCLEKLGIKWDGSSITGGDLIDPGCILDCKNSGTALRFLIAQVASCDFYCTFDGDYTLRERSCFPLLESLGVDVRSKSELDKLPIEIKGPFSKSSIAVEVSKTSQYFSALMLMAPRTNGFTINLSGSPVSQNHSDLTWRLCKITGAKEIGMPWDVECPDTVVIPSDASMSAFAKLANLGITNPPPESESIGHDLDNLDLTNSNDLITPMAAWMAIGNGGKITGAKHSMYKESNRLLRTKDLLNAFGLKCDLTEDGLVIDGNQELQKPAKKVETYGDHRIQMTAIILASMVGGRIENTMLHQIAWPSFLSQLKRCGLTCFEETI